MNNKQEDPYEALKAIQNAICGKFTISAVANALFALIETIVKGVTEEEDKKEMTNALNILTDNIKEHFNKQKT